MAAMPCELELFNLIKPKLGLRRMSGCMSIIMYDRFTLKRLKYQNKGATICSVWWRYCPWNCPWIFITIIIIIIVCRCLYAGINIENTLRGLNYGFDKIRFLQPVNIYSKIWGHMVLANILEKKPTNFCFLGM